MDVTTLRVALDKLIEDSSNPISADEYTEIAIKFQKLTEIVISNIWQTHQNRIALDLNGIKFALPGSSVNTSTAIGFLVEEFIIQQLPDFYRRADGATINSAFDCQYTNDSKIHLVVNLKVEKNSSNNSGVVAGNILQSFYLSNEKPKLYLILKSKYHLDEPKSELVYDGKWSIYLEDFITRFLNADRRSWSEEFNPLSGRIQLPSAGNLREIVTHRLPHPSETQAFIKRLAENLGQSRA
jgi:hypothetical protein